LASWWKGENKKQHSTGDVVFLCKKSLIMNEVKEGKDVKK
jgi:hypothetical protein